VLKQIRTFLVDKTIGLLFASLTHVKFSCGS
jgi:hypothetical protein